MGNDDCLRRGEIRGIRTGPGAKIGGAGISRRVAIEIGGRHMKDRTILVQYRLAPHWLWVRFGDHGGQEVKGYMKTCVNGTSETVDRGLHGVSSGGTYPPPSRGTEGGGGGG